MNTTPLARPGWRAAAGLLASLALSATALAQAPAKGSAAHITATVNKVNAAFMKSNAQQTADWPSYGLDYAETRHSKLNQISTANVKDLGLVWSYNLESKRGVESTPLVVDGIMYVTASWSVVHAVDVRTGKRIWTYDPKVPREAGYKGCCDVVNRGVALHEGKVFVASYDGRLIALDAATGQVAWEKDTIIDRKFSYTITGAPRVFKGNVIIGNGGAEYGVRGYITAYDAKSGAQKWRWFTVPGDPSKPFEDESMAKAAKTWDPAGKWWEAGGGGTAWDAMAFDPELNLMYIGTGNGSPWQRDKRSPAGGDNLYLASIVALNPDTGKYVWHYQQTPGDNWDYTSTQPMILADLTLEGKPRKVILHAPKNGFFFVIDRVTGQFISAKNFVDVNWASGYDKNGRPIETAIARTGDRPREIIPSAFGARNWHSMSFNPATGLVYMPVQGVPLTLMDNKDWKFNGVRPGEPHSGMGWNTANFANVEPPTSKPYGRLIAWDPVKQQAAWTKEQISPWNGGTLTTAGNLVFQGTADGRFIAYNATTGEQLWEAPTGTGVIAAPSTYLVDGKQYVSIAVGWGGVYGLAQRATDRQGPGTVYTFAVGGKAPAPAFVKYQMDKLVAGVKYDPAHVPTGTALYVSNCVFCHGVPGVDRGGNIPNLGYMDAGFIENLDKFVFKGPATERGMPDFTGKLSMDDVQKIKAFIQGTADAIRPKN
ncbi:PQQ-dependent dehydrogenase, methanol/ethanol family [Hydrogenophaga sp.]|uniref:PQQ-dependent dehydrogenase, methanol/ethanol family n=1 Tax=Hydrogenophaga sp. TaxID=1904254 RepID=UPI002730D6E4|nr:PQQ-dependent dehydrogenase, methanol/ethanol family [Hydrogenophaga sp.]MDP2074012.1 PQQ-dependent dehydrogenase, methanol/ethanol family [Hydrogenophaga sp.]MDP3108023.1 PQQ-dependent dehydrogenase, methanol/ethanol family [Hydrogenophaga sp.]MDP3349375.1 PQQ-dependent dehydrogenase, methanol/ethanol family [Hydrogenophaga sp.]MDZ4282645.1 PQQ-dependent dehydrogenase, methanol/ethanol family [Hydrogenophaga sp.]MDZ4399003.1 PQQ-dependent dehydrogenase, methanol/ethanol family [Hydrogenoph